MSNSLVAVHPELVAEWSEKNLPLTPDNVTFGSNRYWLLFPELPLLHCRERPLCHAAGVPEYLKYLSQPTAAG